MRKQYWYIILTYVIMQLSALIGIPLMYKFGYAGGHPTNANLTMAQGIYSVVSFFICLIIVLLILRTAPKQTLRNGKKASAGMSVLWAVAGIWLALFSQGIAGMIEQYVFHVGSGSENTKAILSIIKAMPLMIIVSSIVSSRFLKKSFSGRSFSVYYMKKRISLSPD